MISFGRIDAHTFVGDGSNSLSNVPLSTRLVTVPFHKLLQESVEVLQVDFNFMVKISGSVTSTGSFGRIEADFLHGDGSSIKMIYT